MRRACSFLSFSLSMEEDDRSVAAAAARILLTLRTRTLTEWPDWILPPSKELAAPAEREAELPPLPEGWPKRPRDPVPVSLRHNGWSPSWVGLLARLWQPVPSRSGASSSEEERAWLHPRVRQARRRSASGSAPSPSVKVGARKEALMAASSPETPFDYAIAARSGASSSGDEGAKRKASRSSGDEGCSSPAKRSRPDAHGQDAATAVEVEVPKIEDNSRDEKGHLLFDLNEDISIAW